MFLSGWRQTHFGHFILNRAAVCALTMWHRTKKEGQPRTGWLKKRQREASASFDPPDCSTPQKQSTLVTDAQTSPFQLKTLPILQDADATDLTERSSFVDCQTSPIKQLQSESVTWVTLLVKEQKNIVWLGREANCHQPPTMQTEFISRQTYCVL